MLILGWHGHPTLLESGTAVSSLYHDSAAVLLKDGEVVAAIEEERLNRIKHSNYFPVRAIQFCLAKAGLSLSDVDIIATDIGEDIADLVNARDAYKNPQIIYQPSRMQINNTFVQAFGIDVSSKLAFCRHHIAHLFSAWGPSSFSEALTLCLDGDGDGASGLIAHCKSGTYKILRYLSEADSLGNFYMSQLYFIGYKRFDEYKAMGLAPYGDPQVYAPIFKRMYELLPEGRFKIAPDAEILGMLLDAGLIANSRRKGEEFLPQHRDYAAGLQSTLETIVLHMAMHFQRVTGCTKLCVSGGVAHNCTMNGRLLKSGIFDEVYIQPVGHDAGNALGAALAIAHKSHNIAKMSLKHTLYLGCEVGPDAAIERTLEKWTSLISYERIDDICQVGARLISEGSVIAWVQGRSEFGPRALGNRSILGDPRPAENKSIINKLIKKREAYRPFAPAVIQERLHDYFDVPKGTAALPYMVVVVPVRDEMRQMLGAVTHVDGTARVQSVSQSDNPRFHKLISEFGRLTGVPILLNTSFNNDVEPIADSVGDSIATFLTTGIHSLIIGNYLVQKINTTQLTDRLFRFYATLPPTYRLTKRITTQKLPEYELSSGASIDSGRPSKRISIEIFEILSSRQPTSPHEWCNTKSIPQDRRKSLAAEFLALWEARAICLEPPAHESLDLD